MYLDNSFDHLQLFQRWHMKRRRKNSIVRSNLSQYDITQYAPYFVGDTHDFKPYMLSHMNESNIYFILILSRSFSLNYEFIFRQFGEAGAVLQTVQKVTFSLSTPLYPNSLICSNRQNWEGSGTTQSCFMTLPPSLAGLGIAGCNQVQSGYPIQLTDPGDPGHKSKG